MFGADCADKVSIVQSYNFNFHCICNVTLGIIVLVINVSGSNSCDHINV